MARPIHAGDHGFTLIELLVVVAIIALLISILLPSLQSAREQAKQVQCMSIQKQMGMADAMYINDFAGWHVPYGMPPTPDVGTQLWTNNPHYISAMGLPDEYGRTAPQFATAVQGMICPNATWVLENPVGENRYATWYSYGMNLTSAANDGTENGSWAAMYNDAVGHFQHDVRSPSSKLLWVDALDGGVTAMDTTTAPTYSDTGEKDSAVTGFAGMAAWRHLFRSGDGYANVAFMDGHARGVPKDELIQEPWESLWDPLNEP